MVSLSLVFDQVYRSKLYTATIIFGLTFHFLDIIKSIVSVKTQDGKRIDKLDEIVTVYAENQGIQDILLLIAYIFEITLFGYQIS
jgi:hypothetical protein